jgi:hypothetical protein
VHTNSHLEHVFSPDESLEQRRNALAAADAAADKAHALPILPFDTSRLEPFPLVTPDGTLEKSAGPYLKLCHELRWLERLHDKRMEGALHRTAPIPSWKPVPDHGQTTCAFFGTNLSPTAYLLQPSDTAEEMWKMTSRYPVYVPNLFPARLTSY